MGRLFVRLHLFCRSTLSQTPVLEKYSSLMRVLAQNFVANTGSGAVFHRQGLYTSRRYSTSSLYPLSGNISAGSTSVTRASFFKTSHGTLYTSPSPTSTLGSSPFYGWTWGCFLHAIHTLKDLDKSEHVKTSRLRHWFALIMFVLRSLDTSRPLSGFNPRDDTVSLSSERQFVGRIEPAMHFA